MAVLVIDEQSTITSIETSIDIAIDTQGALVGLIDDYAQAHPQKTSCFSDADTILVWLSRRPGYSQRLEGIFAAGMVQVHERHTVFREAMQTYRSNRRAA